MYLNIDTSGKNQLTRAKIIFSDASVGIFLFAPLRFVMVGGVKTEIQRLIISLRAFDTFVVFADNFTLDRQRRNNYVSRHPSNQQSRLCSRGLHNPFPSRVQTKFFTPIIHS